MIIYNKYITSVRMSDSELSSTASDSPDKSDNMGNLQTPEELDIKDIVKEDINDIDIEPEATDKLDKFISHIHGLPLDKKNQLLANLAKNRDVNPNGNVFYPTSKRDILKHKIHQRRTQKRNQRLGKHVIEHKMEMAEAYKKSKEKASAEAEANKQDNKDEPNETVDVSADGDNEDDE